MGRSQNRPTRDTTPPGQIGCNKKDQHTKNEIELKSFLGAIKHLSKYIEILSTTTDILRKLLKKQNEWILAEEQKRAFNNLKECITNI